MKLKALRPRIAGPAPRGPAPARAGDDRIRGSALQQIRQRILSRDCGVCQCVRCNRTGALRPATIVDHIVPLWAGGLEHDGNRQSINDECHDDKSRHEAACRARGWFEPWNG